MIRFANPEFLGFLIFIPVMILWYIRKRKQAGTVRFSNLGILKSTGRSWRYTFRHLTFVCRLITVTLLIIAIARPQSGSTEEEVITEGIDIILSLDISTSMLAEDFKPKNRLEAAKVVAEEFINGRQNDRIGLVVFAAKSFTQCPLTLDYGILINFLRQVNTDLIDEDGTAIGMAIANCVNRLRESKAKSKVVILLTDGRNNRGQLDPITAAKVAQTIGVKIYTIGAGKRGEALYPVNDPIFGKRYVRMPVEIDEDILKEIASITNGKYFRATDRRSLEQIYEEIGEMEKTKIEVKEFTRYSELYVIYLLLAALFLIVEIILANTVFRKIP
ncbi:VWA domain-containing protein [candidate division KSB1 bacterium]|nr:VWA domain-containing protein [candidate division KSB1 bacterium]